MKPLHMFVILYAIGSASLCYMLISNANIKLKLMEIKKEIQELKKMVGDDNAR